jgi:hypothetical protein
VINGVKGGAEIKRNKCGFFSIGGMEDVVEGAQESCFSGVIATIS